MPHRSLSLSLATLVAAVLAAGPALADERPPPPPPAAVGTKPRPSPPADPAEAEGGIKKKKEKAKKRANGGPGRGGGESDGGGGCCIIAPSCMLGGSSGGYDGEPFPGDDPPPRKPGPKRRPVKTKRFYFDGAAGAVWTIGSSSAASAGVETQGADALLDVQLRFEVKEGIGFDAEYFTLIASDGTLPTYAFHLSFGHVTRKLRVRIGAGARVLDLGDPDVAQIWGFETGPSLDYQLTKRWKWDVALLFAQYPGDLSTGMVSTGFSYGEHVAPRIGYRLFLWEGVEHGPEVGIAFRF